MGITIHFEGRLNGEAEYEALLARVQEFASSAAWPREIIPAQKRMLKRVRDARDWDYIGITKGIVVQPNKNTDPLRFEFDDKLYIQEYCKTQFADPSVHISVVELLRTLQPLFASLSVDDEGEYWETGDRAILIGHMQWVDGRIAEMIAEEPTRKSAVRLDSGRIADVIG